MAFDPATVQAVVSIGIQLYEFIDKVKKGEKGTSLQPIVKRLDELKHDINNLGQTLHRALDEAVDVIVDDIRLTQLSKVPDVHRSCVDYLKINPTVPYPPVFNDGNYIRARGTSSEAYHYFINHQQLAFMGGFIAATNARIEFITSLDVCWPTTDPGYLTEIRDAVHHLNGYIGRVKAGIDKKYVVRTKVNAHVETDTEPPFGHPQKVIDSYTFTVGATGEAPWTRTVPVEQQAAGRQAAENERRKRSLAKQAEIMGPYDRISAAWNGLAADFASLAVQRSLLGGESVASLRVAPASLAVTELPDVPAPSHAAASARREAAPQQRLRLPMRETLVRVLGSDEFQQRHKNGAADHDEFARYWFRKAVHRDPTDEERTALVRVLTLFGRVAFFACVGYSDEYDKRWGDSAPDREVRA